MDVDDGPWQDLAEVHPPHRIIPSRKVYRRHLYYPDHVGRPNTQRRILGCQVGMCGQRPDTSKCGSLRPS